MKSDLEIENAASLPLRRSLAAHNPVWHHRCFQTIGVVARKSIAIATIKGNGESIMATKITTALVAALVVGALMTPNHEALARGGGGFGGGGHGGGFGGGGFHGGGFHGGGFGFHRGFGRGYGFGRGFGYGRRFGFYGGSPTFMAGMGMAAVHITTAPTGAIEQHGALVLWRGRGGAHPRGATRGSVVIAAGLPRTPAGVYEGVMNMTRIDRILFALSLVTANLPLGITYAMLLAR